MICIVYNISYLYLLVFFFFFNDTATTEIYTLSLHDALPFPPPSLAGLAVTPGSLSPPGPRGAYSGTWLGRPPSSRPTHLLLPARTGTHRPSCRPRPRSPPARQASRTLFAPLHLSPVGDNEAGVRCSTRRRGGAARRDQLRRDRC